MISIIESPDSILKPGTKWYILVHNSEIWNLGQKNSIVFSDRHITFEIDWVNEGKKEDQFISIKANRTQIEYIVHELQIVISKMIKILNLLPN